MTKAYPKVQNWALAIAYTVLLNGCSTEEKLVFGKAPLEPAISIISLFAEEPVIKNLADTDQLIDALNQGLVDAAIIEQPSTAISGVSAVAAVFPSVLHVLVREELISSGTNISLSSLMGRGSVYPGPTGSVGHKLLIDLAKDGSLPPLQDIELLDSPFGQPPDIYFLFGGLLSGDALARLQGYQLVALSPAELTNQGSWIDGVVLRHLHLQSFVIPEGLYPSLNHGASQTLAVQSLLVVRQGLPNHLAYQLAEQVYQLGSRIESIYPLARHTLNTPLESTSLNLPVHVGAMLFQTRNAPSFLERYAELIALVTTLVIALTSALIAWLRSRKQAKKDRIDEYFIALLDLRTAHQDSKQSAVVLRDQAHRLQDKVTRLVVEERINADASYVGFIALSNQLIRELER